MFEVEVKVRAPHDAVRERLDSAGATRLETVEQADTYYDAPHRDFAETDEALRVRRETIGEEKATEEEKTTEEGELGRVTYKGPRIEDGSKTRREVETGVAEAADAEEILRAVGFEAAATVRKEREQYELDGYTITLDSVAGLGEFVEVETDVEDEDEIESAREEAFAVLRRLGLDPSEQIQASYLELLIDETDDG